MRQNVPILVYHHVYRDTFLESINTKHDSATGMIKESEFRLHLNYIMENNWSVISTNQLSDWIEGKVEIPEKSDTGKNHCPDCNSKIGENSKFCRMCGKFPI